MGDMRWYRGRTRFAGKNSDAYFKRIDDHFVHVIIPGHPSMSIRMRREDAKKYFTIDGVYEHFTPSLDEREPSLVCLPWKDCQK